MEPMKKQPSPRPFHEIVPPTQVAAEAAVASKQEPEKVPTGQAGLKTSGERLPLVCFVV